MRQLLETLLDILSDPSIIELVLSGPSISAKDFLIGLAWILGTTVVTKGAMSLLWPAVAALVHRMAPSLAGSWD